MTFDRDRYHVDEEVEVVRKPPMIVTPEGITIIIDGESFSLRQDHPNYALTLEAIREERWGDLKELVDVQKVVAAYTAEGNIEVKDGAIYYTDPRSGATEPCHGFVVDRIFQFMEEGLDPKPLMKFLDKLMSNPSYRVIQDLYTFLSNRNMPIDEDGDFYGYKAVRNNFMDKFKGEIDNSVGQRPSVPRRSVDDNPKNACSYGLHVGSIQYVSNFACRFGEEGGDQIIICKVNPADVVSVPEYDTTKLRCCEYEVVDLYRGVLPDTTWERGGMTEEEIRKTREEELGDDWDDDFEDPDDYFDEDEEWGEDDEDEADNWPY